MTLLEYIGVLFIILYFHQRIKWIKLKARVEDPELSIKRLEFERMRDEFGRLEDIRDLAIDPNNINLVNISSILETVVRGTVPLPQDAMASDFRSKYIDYCAINAFSSAIIEAEQNSKPIHIKEISIKAL